MNPHWPRRGLYAITPDEPDTGAPAGAGGSGVARRRRLAAIPQQGRERRPAAPNRRWRCSRFAARFDVPLIINDDWAPGARPSVPPGRIWAKTTAKSRWPRHELGADAILGASCYDDLRLRGRPSFAGASYVAFGAFFPSTTKPNARRATPALLRDAARARPAAGGDRRHHAGQCASAGRSRRRHDRGDQRRVRRARSRRGRARLPLLLRRPRCHEQRPLARPVHPRQELIPGGVNSPVRAFKSVGGEPFFAQRAEGAVPVRCRRQPLHRLRRLLGPDDRRPRASAGARRGDAHDARRPQLRRAQRARSDDGRSDHAASCRVARWCAW